MRMAHTSSPSFLSISYRALAACLSYVCCMLGVYIHNAIVVFALCLTGCLVFGCSGFVRLFAFIRVCIYLMSYPRHLDPFGSCAPYLDTVFRRCPKGGVVALTCTDVPALFGCPPRVAARNYNGIQLRRTPIKRELAARVVLASATL